MGTSVGTPTGTGMHVSNSHPPVRHGRVDPVMLGSVQATIKNGGQVTTDDYQRGSVNTWR
jgi:hypothetical protein